MNLQIKSSLIIIGTLLLGIVLGTLISGMLAERRFQRIHSMMKPPQFAEELVEAIGPKDEPQRREIMAIINETDQKIQNMMHQSREEMHAAVDSLAAKLQPLLTVEQKARLEKHLGDRRHRPMEPPKEQFPGRRPQPGPIEPFPDRPRPQ
jgi:hypothetical protein